MRPDVNAMVKDAASGSRAAVEELLGLLQDELRQIAGTIMRGEPASQTLQPTALVNEACVRLLSAAALQWNDRAHFLAIAAQAMRQILISHARARKALKRSARGERVTLSGGRATLPRRRSGRPE
ncbi:MAG: ECF-type sigma factor [Phycisphaerales bacterium]